MKYKKYPLSFGEQADLLISRGLQGDKDFMIQILQNVNYYRLSGYLYPYRKSGDDFKPNTMFSEVWRHYTFDRRLRLVVMDAIERVEISIRTQLIHQLSHSTGAFGYIKHSFFPNISESNHSRLLSSLEFEFTRSREVFVRHFKKKYGDEHAYLPFWMVGEIMSFGSMLTMYMGTSSGIKRGMAAYYGVPDEVLTSWLKTINVVRNICAHHGRLWNRVLGVKPYIPRKNKYTEWHVPVQITQDKVFGIITILYYMLSRVASKSRWRDRFENLLKEYPDVNIQNMGFPINWRASRIWNDK